ANQAAMMGAKRGDKITLTLPGGTKLTQRSVGLINTVEGQPLIYVDVSRTPRVFQQQGITSIYATGKNPTAVREALKREFTSRPDVQVNTREELIAAESADFQLILSVMYAMFGAAIIIAVFGVINTLALSVVERTRELGILRAVGAPARLIR